MTFAFRERYIESTAEVVLKDTEFGANLTTGPDDGEENAPSHVFRGTTDRISCVVREARYVCPLSLHVDSSAVLISSPVVVLDVQTTHRRRADTELCIIPVWIVRYKTWGMRHRWTYVNNSTNQENRQNSQNLTVEMAKHPRLRV